MNLRDLMKKHKELISYMFWGATTTFVDWSLYFLCRGWMGAYWATAAAWAGAVIFAFVTNKLFVFASKSWSPAVAVPEFVKFAGARVFTLGLTEGIMWLFVKQLSFPDGLVKIGSSVLTVIINYVFSKLFIFRRKENG